MDQLPLQPTAASADVAFYERVIEFCQSTSRAGTGPLIAASDLAYSEIYLDGPAKRPPSMWQARNASIDETLGIEFHSLSKTFNMTGWRIGFAVGHADVVGALNSIKSNVDSGTFNAIQAGGAEAPPALRRPRRRAHAHPLPRAARGHHPRPPRRRVRDRPARLRLLHLGPDPQGARRQPCRFHDLRRQVP